VVLGNECWGVYVSFRFPRVFSVRVAFPMNTILFLLLASIVAHASDSLDFPFGLSFDDIGWWLQEVGAMLFCLLIRR
jgi:hypothetical protein